jgi:IS5 family transposase
MRPKKTERDQGELFRARLDQILNPSHPLYVLSNKINWESFEEEFGSFYVEDKGRPGVPIRMIVGLHYLKHAFNESDESVVDRFLENPYWQHFCGFEYFQHKLPMDPTTLVKWRKRVGAEGMEKLLKETIESGKCEKLIKKSQISRVNVDTTVQEKAIAFPTDARLYYKMRKRLVGAAKDRKVELRQSYARVGKLALHKQGRYSHAKQMRRAGRETKRLKTYLGRVMRDIKRKVEKPDEELIGLLKLAEGIYNQKQKDKKKVYSVHAPEVECISKGKAHKRYEFGCKVSVVSTSKDNWVVGIDAIHGNPYDGHTLKGSLKQAERLTGYRAEEAYCDRGYRGTENLSTGTTIHLTDRKRKRVSRSLWKWLRRRSAIEPIIGHLKTDNPMERNYLKGKEGDRMNAMLSACGFNMRKLLRAFLFPILQWVFTADNRDKTKINGSVLFVSV